MLGMRDVKKSSKMLGKMAVEKQLSCTEELCLLPYIFIETSLGKFAHDTLCLSFTVNKICTLTPVDSCLTLGLVANTTFRSLLPK